MIYLAVPYSGTENSSFKAVNAYAGMLMGEGHFVISPISMCHLIARQIGLPTEFDYWRKFDFKLIDVCDCIVVLCLERWVESRGVMAEVNYAFSVEKPIHYRLPHQTPSNIEVIDGK